MVRVKELEISISLFWWLLFCSCCRIGRLGGLFVRSWSVGLGLIRRLVLAFRAFRRGIGGILGRLVGGCWEIRRFLLLSIIWSRKVLCLIGIVLRLIVSWLFFSSLFWSNIFQNSVPRISYKFDSKNIQQVFFYKSWYVQPLWHNIGSYINPNNSKLVQLSLNNKNYQYYSSLWIHLQTKFSNFYLQLTC